MTVEVAEAKVDYNHPNPFITFAIRQKAKEIITQEEVEETLEGYTNTGIRELITLFGEIASDNPKEYPFPSNVILNAVSKVQGNNIKIRNERRVAVGLNETEAHVIENVRIAREKNEFYKEYDGGKHYQSRVKDTEVKMPEDWFLLEEMEQEIMAKGHLQSERLKKHSERMKAEEPESIVDSIPRGLPIHDGVTNTYSQFSANSNDMQVNLIVVSNQPMPPMQSKSIEDEFQENKASMSLGERIARILAKGLERISEYVNSM